MRALQQGGATVDYTLQFRDVWLNRDFFIEGLYFTVYLTVVSMSVAVVIGTLAAVARNSANRFVRTIASTYVEVVRNTPLLIQLWLVYFGLSQIGIELNALTSGLLVLSLNTGAYTAEILRAGFESVDKEIIDGAAALGLTPWLTFRSIILPLGFRAVLPSLSNMTLQCLLASALVSVLGVNELTNQALRVASKTFRSLESFAVIGVLYISLTFLIAGMFKLLEKRMAKGALH
jgi:polar amino acid transport system permease protein